MSKAYPPKGQRTAAENVTFRFGNLLGVLVVLPVLILLAWNLGLASIVSASGGHVDHISYWAALGVTALYFLARGVLSANRTA